MDIELSACSASIRHDYDNIWVELKGVDAEDILCAFSKNMDPRSTLARLISVLRVYYPGSDEGLNRLAENAFSGCASTQREKTHELRDFLKEVESWIVNV
jgi:hypothetical protein